MSTICVNNNDYRCEGELEFLGTTEHYTGDKSVSASSTTLATDLVPGGYLSIDIPTSSTSSDSFNNWMITIKYKRTCPFTL